MVPRLPASGSPCRPRQAPPHRQASRNARDEPPNAPVRGRIERTLEGHEPFTFVLEDPTGNSDVIHEDAVRDVLTRKEAERLKSSETLLGLADPVHPDEEE